MIVNSWKAVTEETIVNCWKKCKILDCVIDTQINDFMNIDITDITTQVEKKLII